VPGGLISDTKRWQEGWQAIPAPVAPTEPKLIPIVTTAEQVYAVSFAHFLPGLGVPCYYLPDTFNSKETGKVGNVFDKPGNNSHRNKC
jgi:hypothetical protein